MKLAVLASHTGSTLQAILDAIDDGRLEAECAVVICNNRDAFALRRARRHGVPACLLNGRTHPNAEALDRAVLATLEGHGAEIVALAGYMKKLGPFTVARYRGRIVNTHPALLPDFGGRGMYGDKVHASVLAAGRATTGVTVHLVDEEYDHGPVLAQTTVPVLPGDTVDTLRDRVQKVERGLYVETLQRVASGAIKLPPAV